MRQSLLEDPATPYLLTLALAATTLIFLLWCVSKLRRDSTIMPFRAWALVAGIATCFVSAACLWVLGWTFKPAGTGMKGWWIVSVLWLLAGLSYMLIMAIKRYQKPHGICTEHTEDF